MMASFSTTPSFSLDQCFTDLDFDLGLSIGNTDDAFDTSTFFADVIHDMDASAAPDFRSIESAPLPSRKRRRDTHADDFLASLVAGFDASSGALESQPPPYKSRRLTEDPIDAMFGLPGHVRIEAVAADGNDDGSSAMFPFAPLSPVAEVVQASGGSCDFSQYTITPQDIADLSAEFSDGSSNGSSSGSSDNPVAL